MGVLPQPWPLAASAPAGVARLFRAAVESLGRQQEYDFCDGLRALAVLWVCADHGMRFVELFLPGMGWRLYQLWWPVAVPASGEVGVDIFLVLSGFLIGGALQREMATSGSIAVGRFCVRRVFRIFPAVYTAMLATMIGDIVYSAPPQCPNQEKVANLLILNNLPIVDKLTCMGHTWSVALELQLYLVTPFLFMASARIASLFPGSRLPAWTVTCAVCAAGWLACGLLRLRLALAVDILSLYSNHYAWIAIYLQTQFRFGSYAAGVLAGILVAVGRAEGWSPAGRVPSWAISASCAFTGLVLAASCVFGGDLTAVSDPTKTAWYRTTFPTVALLHVAFLRPLIGAGIAGLILLCSFGMVPAIGGFLGWRGWRPLAGLSYSMYLLQFVGWLFLERPFVLMWDVKIFHWPIWVGILMAYAAVALFVLASVPLAFLSYALVELPGIQAGKHFLALSSRWLSHVAAKKNDCCKFMDLEGSAGV